MKTNEKKQCDISGRWLSSPIETEWGRGVIECTFSEKGDVMVSMHSEDHNPFQTHAEHITSKLRYKITDGYLVIDIAKPGGEIVGTIHKDEIVLHGVDINDGVLSLRRSR